LLFVKTSMKCVFSNVQHTIKGLHKERHHHHGANTILNSKKQDRTEIN